MKVFKTTSVDCPGLGAKIRQIRESKNISATELAKGIGISRQHVYKIEDESHDLPLETLRKIEQVLNTDFGVSL